MNKINLTMGIGGAWLALFANPVQAYLVDWKSSYTDEEFLSQKEGNDQGTELVQNNYGWNRSVQVWQSFTAERTAKITGIALQLYSVKGFGAIDLNVYEGIAVLGHLISATKLEWDTGFDGGWYGFKLETPVNLEAGKRYTFSLENLQDEQNTFSYSIMPVVNANVSNEKTFTLYMQQGYFGMLPGKQGYMGGVTNAAINFILLKSQEVNVVVPESTKSHVPIR